MIKFAGLMKHDRRMTFIDTHTHLYDEAFSGDEDGAVRRAMGKGVEKMILPDIDSLSREAMFRLAGSYPGILFPCLGLHPTSVDGGWEKEIASMEKYADRTVYAIGEIGIDCYWSKEFLDQQKTALKIQLEMADRAGLPVIIHSRNAEEHICEVLKGCSGLNLRGVFHAFSGSSETCARLGRYGEWYFGIGGVVTYRNASVAETVKRIPLERILLETDSPYLTPVPFRGQRNESGNIPVIAAKIAELKGISIEQVAETTTENARRLFGI